MNKLIAIAPILARGGRRAAKAPEGSAASGKALGEIACLSPDDALERLSSAAAGLTADQVEERLRSAGLNQVAHQARHTILGELVGRSINPLNLLLLSLATASYFLGDQRAAELHPGTSFQQCRRQAATDGVDKRDRAPTDGCRGA